MQFGLRSTFVLLFVCSLSCGLVAQEAAAQGPLLKKLRSYNGGRPLLPFVSEPSPLKPPSSARVPSLAKKPAAATKTSVASRTPTPANKKQPSLVKKPTPANDSRSRERASAATRESASSAAQPNKIDQSLAAKGFGMWIQESRKRFFVSQVTPRGNAAAAGLQRGDLIVNVGGAPLKVLDEYAAIAKAMRVGDRVEIEFSRRGSKPKKVAVLFGKAPPVKQPPVNDRAEDFKMPASPAPAIQEPARYEPDASSGLRSVYEGSGTPSSSGLEPTPAPRSGNRDTESLEIDLPSLDFE